ncbi:gamma-glutamylcyclotransferase family protein [Cesiribacter andamanensis]|uniref:Gamma-glutamylcyclotransferase family protein ytfP n=1 Tax=Cesiribacter andamanensis AMV16 TaxID=1279009 RepID=M7N795_9BACT|nr:gamma-glutamylcyclotransferase family protein [Cesiribacter andamanensis]EMR04488.1 Gamma-glutamylcyclotransferase family protein ytfP [Cesiribacter andamanensis AMV16]
MHQLFVYGTLRKGGISHHLLKGGKVMAEGVWLEGFRLYSAGWYPVAVLAAGGRILGDLVNVPEVLWPALDAYEGEEYERVYLQKEAYWIYQYKGNINNMPLVEGGDWLKWKR